MTVRRDALGLGVVASLFALFARGAARAADRLVIGSDGVAWFTGRRNYFSDEENAGILRVGAALGVPGIYSNKGPVGIGSENGHIWLQGKVGIGANKKAPSQSLDVDGTIAATAITAADATLKSLTVEEGVKKGLIVAGAGVTELPSAGANTLDVVRAPRSKLEVAGPPKWVGNHPTGLALYVTAESGEDSNGVEFRHSNGTHGIGFGYTTIYATGSHPNQNLVLKARGTGSVQIGAQSKTQVDLHVPGGVEPLRMLRGIVGSNGTKYAGEGFSVSRFKEGLYDITFDKGFPSVPGASVTQVFGGIERGNALATSEGSGDTRDNAVIAHLSADRMRVKTGQGGGYAADRYFSFIVIGPR
jgi:hypothetical protein